MPSLRTSKQQFCQRSSLRFRSMLALTLLTLCMVPRCNGQSQDSPQTVENAESAGLEPEITTIDRQHWSFQSRTPAEIPEIPADQWSSNPIDRFIRSRLDESRLSPMPKASRTTLIRRVTFDLTGLPPTPSEIRAFVNDREAGAWERVVDRLLSSSRYGERWAQHWLDLARFAETDGFEHDKVRQSAWRYRDWVITALNSDMPFDQFLQWQIAGDELAPERADAHIATGFLLCGPDMPDINLQDERRHNVLNEMTATTGAVFLGLQFGCAQCHDHKFDPISQADFYRLRAFFESARFFRDMPLPDPRYESRRAAFEADRTQRWQQLEETIRRIKTEQKQNPTKANAEQIEKLEKDLSAVRNERGPQPELARILTEPVQQPVESFLRIRGDFRRIGPRVQAAYPRLLNEKGLTVEPAVRQRSTGQRTALARWMTHPENPLTSRVIVNRIWKDHFGTGLVGTPSDFGLMGDVPTHPLLLDWLATELIRRKWSLKSLHRLILTSATWRQMSYPEHEALSERFRRNRQKDPENQLLSRFPRQRMQAEMIRDSLLFVSGTLVDRRGGSGVRPPLPRELTSTLLKNQWPVSERQEDHYRRSIYLFVRRNLRYPLFQAFDKPDTNASCAMRNRSTTAPQALMMMNSQQSMTAARMLACRILRSHSDRTSQIDAGYWLVFGHAPSELDRSLCLHLLDELSREELTDHGDWDLPFGRALPGQTSRREAESLTALCLAWLNTNEFICID